MTEPSLVQLLVFEVHGVQFALPLPCVREVVRAVLITPLPESPAVVEGVIDVRGRVVPVYDLRARFRLPARRLHPDDRLVIAWTGERLVALRCERADRIESVAPSDIQPRAVLSTGGRRIAGVTRTASGLALIQDLPRFLDDAEHAVLADALAARVRRDAD